MNRPLPVILVLGCTAAGSLAATPTAEIAAGTLRLHLDERGRIVSLQDTASGRQCLPPDLTPALLAVVSAGTRHEPSGAALAADGRQLELTYPTGSTLSVAVTTAPTHATFRVTAVGGPLPDKIEWGPYPVTVGKVVGEVIAVARDDTLAVGLQGLTVQVTAAASAQPYGSQLYAWASEHDGGIRGAGIALFGCPEPAALPTIGAIEVAEGLPHPLLDGVWDKVSPDASQAYLISDFSEADLDAHVALAQGLGVRYLYHPGPFRTWGHFVLDERRFPGGDASLRRCADRAATAGLRLGVHTLTAFITPNDAYVTPRPDPRLARLGSSRTAAAVDAQATVIPVAAREPFVAKQNWGWSRRFARIDDEILEYAGVSETAPVAITGCQRGAFGTAAAAHAADADIGSLATHNYGTFYPGVETGMMDEMTARLVELFRTCGLRQISFDGLEGLIDYGGWQGDYTRNRFVRQCVDGWPQHVISDASNLLHGNWHAHTRMNWGEPWGKAMREGMPEYRFRNQAFFERNYLPRMLGWFELRAAAGDLDATSVDDMEWMLAKAAGYDSGFAVVTHPSTVRANGQGEACVTAVREWEKARRARAFPPALRERLRRADADWHLEPTGPAAWRLWPVAFSPLFGAPAEATDAAPWTFENPFAEQPLRVVLRLLEAPGAAALVNPVLDVNGTQVQLPVRVEPRHSLVADGSGRLTVCDANWQVTTTVEAQLPPLATGANRLRVTAGAGTAAVRFEVRFRALGPAEPITAPATPARVDAAPGPR